LPKANHSRRLSAGDMLSWLEMRRGRGAGK